VRAFKDENIALQELVRELILVRDPNLAFKDGEPLNDVLLFAEAGLVCMTFEHFVRVVVGDAGPSDATLFNLLEIAVAKRLMHLPWDEQLRPEVAGTGWARGKPCPALWNALPRTSVLSSKPPSTLFSNRRSNRSA
jgi:hypothetical protein